MEKNRQSRKRDHAVVAKTPSA